MRTNKFDHVARVFFVSCLLLLTACQSSETKEPALSEKTKPRISAGGEQLQGVMSEQYPQIAEFLGVPFAKPPVGDLRWRAPQPHAPREGIQEASQFKAACQQGSSGVDWYVDVAESFGHSREVVKEPVALSEDCLYLNVWTPAKLDQPPTPDKLPVLVWIHGGGNTGGWAYEPNYVGASLSRNGIVVVSIAYRLGIFGFFSHPGMQDDQQEHIANFGLLDQILGLQWVKNNIAQFGGDANNVTVAGESAGSANIGYMLASPMAQSLFQRSIHQSGSFELNDHNTVDDVHAQVHTLNRADDASNSEHLAALRELDAVSLQSLATSKFHDDYYYPVVDGKVLADTVHRFYLKENNQPRDIMVGSNADEWLMYMDAPDDPSAIDEWLAENIPAADANAVKKELGVSASDHKKLELLVTAGMMRCPGYYLAAKNAEQGGRSWVYHFDRVRSGSGGDALGSYHGAELPYMFDTHDSWLPTEDVDRALTSSMVDYWVSFVKTGNPNSEKAQGWPRYQDDSQQVMVLGERIYAADAPHSALCDWLGPQDSEVEY